jgi:periplasmic protein CpxP/Spy
VCAFQRMKPPGALATVKEKVVKRLPLVIALGAMLASPIGFAQQDADEHAAHHPQDQTVTPASQPEHDQSPGDGKLQQNMKKMQDLMAQILKTEDPKLRSELLQQHLQAMRDQIKMMRKMTGMKMDTKGDAIDGRAKSEKKDGMMGGSMMMHKKMEQRLEMLEQMLEQMVEHEAAEQSLESK